MPLSRFRVRLVWRFAISFLAGLTLLNVALFAFLRHRADRRLSDDLAHAVADLELAVRTELAEPDEPGLRHAAQSALDEYPARADAFVIVDSTGDQLAARGPAEMLTRLRPLPPLDRTATLDRPAGAAAPLRLVLSPSVTGPRFAVIALESTGGLAGEVSTLAWWLALSVPAVSLIGIGLGYVLAGGALRPIDELGSAIAGIAPDELARRLPVAAPADEVDRVTAQVNDLLERLETAQTRNRSFILRTAHQIRTPLTLLLGESALALERPRDDEAYRDALRRIRLAAEQMRHRVEELQLLAQAEAGERPRLEDQVELDGLLLECADLMRARADACGQSLGFGEVQPLVVRGHEALLREAVLELVENACRHASAGMPIELSAVREDSRVRITVASGGAGAGAAVAGSAPSDDGRGLGLAIVRWIAQVHGGALVFAHADGRNRFTLDLPAA